VEKGTVRVADLCGAHEIAERVGVGSVQTVHAWRRRYPDFPKPIAQLRRGLIWDWQDVERWAKRIGRL
jgi:chromosome partitioning protein